MESNLLGNVSNLFSLAISKIKGYFVLLRTKMELFKNTLVQILVSYHSNNPHNKLKINKKETKNGELRTARSKPGETLVEDRSGTDVQIVRRSCL